MQVPAGLEREYQSNHELSSWVSSALARIDAHIKSNRMTFFPEYTDHGISHLELTLQTAIDLATETARGLLTEFDAAILTVAVALHGFGMYLTRDGFESLIAKDSVWRGVPGWDDKPWTELWTDFYGEATRFDERKLRQLFGDNYRPIRPLPVKGEEYHDFDYLLVGEFLRRHHPRLANEIALYGLPGKDGEAIPVCLAGNDQHFWSEIAGLIARSHGIDLRPCLTLLELQYDNRINPRGVHAAFLAVLLRIADYFQIQAMRAPKAHTQVVRLKSQLSEREWKVHQSVSDIHNTSNDPEAIVITANPGNVPNIRMQAKEVAARVELKAGRVIPLNRERTETGLAEEIRILNAEYRALWRLYLIIHPSLIVADADEWREYQRLSTLSALVDRFCDHYGVTERFRVRGTRIGYRPREERIDRHFSDWRSNGPFASILQHAPDGITASIEAMARDRRVWCAVDGSGVTVIPVSRDDYASGFALAASLVAASICPAERREDWPEPLQAGSADSLTCNHLRRVVVAISPIWSSSGTH